MICSLTPPNVFHSNSSQIIMISKGDNKDEAYLLGVLSSIPLDWYARRFVEINLNFFLFNPLPIPRPGRDNNLWLRIVNLAGRLACPDERFKEWAEKIGVDFGPLEADIKNEMIFEIDALVSHLYELNEKQLIHIYETFHKGWNYEERLEKVLNYFRYHKRREI